MDANSRREPGFCKWLLDVLDNERSPENAYWLDKDERVFAVRWVHASSAAWSPECAELFKLWKIEGSRGREKSDAPIIYRDLKTNFRMNLRSDKFRELTAMRKIGDDPVRCYKVVETMKKRPKQGGAKKERKPKSSYHMATSKKSFPRNGFRGTSFENNSRGTDVTFYKTADQNYQINNGYPQWVGIEYQNSCRYTQPRVTTQQGLMTQDIYTQQEPPQFQCHHVPHGGPQAVPEETIYHGNLGSITTSEFFPEDPTSDMTIMELLNNSEMRSPYNSENFLGNPAVMSSGIQNYDVVGQASIPSLSWCNDSTIDENYDFCWTWGKNEEEQFMIK